MYDVKPYEPKIRLISNGNEQEIYEFENYNKFLDWVDFNFIKYRIVDKFSKGSLWELSTLHWRECREMDGSYWGFRLPREICYIVRDEFGSVYSVNEIKHDYYKRRDELRRTSILKRSCWSKRFNHPYKFRRDPVPGTGRHYKFGYQFRSPQTTQELRRNCSESEFARGKRKKGYLPNSWDDVMRSDRKERKNWKRNRKTQWKGDNYNKKYMTKITSFFLWYNELKQICEECYDIDVKEISKKEWRVYFNDGYSPAAAAAEEFYYE